MSQRPTPEPPRAAPTSLGGSLGRVGVFVLAMGAVLAALRAVAAPAGGGLVGAKVQHYRAAAGSYDTVFLGSSHVYRSFQPEVFDAALGERGLDARSFNFGLQLPHLYEASHLLREILATGAGEHGALRRVFFEYQSLTPQIDPANAFIPRTIYWHDGATTLLALRRTAELEREVGLDYVEDPRGGRSVLRLSQRALPAAWRIGAEHALHWVDRVLLVGRGRDVAKGLLRRPHGQTERVAHGVGYVPLEEEDARLAAQGQVVNPFSRRHEHFQASLDEYRRRVDELRREPVVFGDEEWMNAALQRVDDLGVLRDMVDACRSAGVELVLVVMPANSCDRPQEQRLGRELGVPVLIYNDPERHAELYRPELRFDSGHPSRAGAEAFTRALARDFAELEL